METTPFLIVFARHSSSSSNNDSVWWILPALGVVLILAMLSDRRRSKQNKERIAEYFASRGSVVLDYSNEKLGGRRCGYLCHYDIRYRDPDGMEYIGHCSVVGGEVGISSVQPVKDVVTREHGKPAPLLSPQLPAAGIAGPGDFFVHGLDHVQLAMPFGMEEMARRFYGSLLGLKEVPKPAHLAKRGGVWFEGGSLKLHLGVDVRFDPALKAHPALLVKNLPALIAWLEKHGVNPVKDEPLPGFRRVYVSDPFQNRIELLEPLPAER